MYLYYCNWSVGAFIAFILYYLFFILFELATSDGRTAAAPFIFWPIAFSRSSRNNNNPVADDPNAPPLPPPPPSPPPVSSRQRKVDAFLDETNMFQKATPESVEHGSLRSPAIYTRERKDKGVWGHPRSAVVQSVSKRSQGLRSPIRRWWLSRRDAKQGEPPKIQSRVHGTKCAPEQTLSHWESIRCFCVEMMESRLMSRLEIVEERERDGRIRAAL